MDNDIEGPPPRRANLWIKADGTRLPVPYIKVPALFAKTHRRGDSVTAVFHALLHLSRDSSWFKATYKDLQLSTGYIKKTVIRAVKKLEAEKWIEVNRYRRPGSSLNDINEYRILHPKSPPKQRKRPPPRTGDLYVPPL